MSRPLARRLTALGVVGGCLAAAAAPAVADHGTAAGTHSVTVEATSTTGTRHFHVYEQLRDVAPEKLVFNGSGEQPFRVVVEDENKDLDTGFQVTASMTNLYWQDPDDPAAPLDPDVIIPSRNLALAYGLPLRADDVVTPASPVLDIAVALPNCLDPGIASALNLTIPTVSLPGLSLLDTLLQSLSGSKRTICEALGQGGSFTTTATKPPFPLTLGDVTDQLALDDLPLALTGGQESGVFTNPAYQAGMPAPDNAPAATTKRVMRGRPHVSSTLLDRLDGLLTTASGTIFGTADSLFTSADALTSIGGLTTGLQTGIDQLKTESQTEAQALQDRLVSGVTVVRRKIDADALATVTGTYTAHPVLRANTMSARPGLYEGTLTIDFIDGVE